MGVGGGGGGALVGMKTIVDSDANDDLNIVI